MEEKKTIRFIDSHYNTLFTIQDGESIEISYPDRDTVERVCEFIDEYHTKVGVNVFHICEFAEKMEAINATYCPLKHLEKERHEVVRPPRESGTFRR